MGAKTDEFENYLTNVSSNFLNYEEAKKEYYKSNLQITHIWVSGFGWENTILIEEDFKTLEKISNENDICIFLGVQKESDKQLILKGYINE